MRTDTSAPSHMRVILLLVMGFVLFYSSMSEDQLYKNWNREFSSLFKSYIDIEYYCHLHLPVNEKIILDLSDFKGVYDPFEHSVFGKARRYVYYRLSPSNQKVEHLIKKGDENMRIVRIGRQYKFKLSLQPSTSTIAGMGTDDKGIVTDLMKKNGIHFIIFAYYKMGWTLLIQAMDELGYDYVHGNAHFILFRERVKESL